MPTEDEYDTTENSPNTSGRDLSADDLRSLTERIQVGDTDEGAAALNEIMTRARGAATVDRDSIRQMMLEESAQMRLKAENTQALDNFAAKYPQLKEDNLLVDAAKRVLRDRIVDDMKGAGASDDDIAPIREDVGRLVAAHGLARMKGAKLRSADDLLNDTGRTLTEKFNRCAAHLRNISGTCAGIAVSKTMAPASRSAPKDLRRRTIAPPSIFSACAPRGASPHASRGAADAR